jgi:hypothetical protein
MEYTFRNSATEVPTTLHLSDEVLTVSSGKEKFSVPYLGVVQVNLDKVNTKVYRAIVHVEGHSPIVITNRYCVDAVTVEDRSRAYSTFIRVMHYHLKDKSKAHYASGSETSKLWTQVVVAAAVSFILSFVCELMGVGFMNPFVQGAILSLVMGSLIFAWRAGHWPKTYKPTEIPMRFLP